MAFWPIESSADALKSIMSLLITAAEVSAQSLKFSKFSLITAAEISAQSLKSLKSLSITAADVSAQSLKSSKSLLIFVNSLYASVNSYCDAIALNPAEHSLEFLSNAMLLSFRKYNSVGLLLFVVYTLLIAVIL